jgi:REP element-mobilizing transposase RayT
MLRQQLRRFERWLLDYCLTSNHVHLLIALFRTCSLWPNPWLCDTEPKF